MPDIWTRYPEIVKEILQEAGFKCGIEQKKILVDCVTERFCAFSSPKIYGEICIHDLPQAVSSDISIFLILALGIAVAIIAILSVMLIKKTKRR